MRFSKHPKVHIVVLLILVSSLQIVRSTCESATGNNADREHSLNARAILTSTIDQLATVNPAPAAGGSSAATAVLSHAAFRYERMCTTWRFKLPQLQLRKGLVYSGSGFRLRRVVHDMLSGRPVKIGVVGGSISWGHGASKYGLTDWVSLLRTYMQGLFGNKVTVRNGCVPATPSSFMVMCLEMSVDADVDLVFVEYHLNDGIEDSVKKNTRTRSYERLMRRLLGLQHRPALVLLQMPSDGSLRPASDPDHIPFHMSNEDLYAALAQYYDAPYLSFRTATHRLNRLYPNASSFNNTHLMMMDYRHPVDLGHHVMADLAVYLLQRTASSLKQRPWGRDDEVMDAELLPEPMIPGNHVPHQVTCAHMDQLVPLVVQARGFEYLAEGSPYRPKKGYVATKPGSTLSIRIDTRRAHTDGGRYGGLAGSKENEGAMLLAMAYLKSYEHMGRFRLDCVSGCSCEAREVEGHHTEKDSQTYVAQLLVSQSARCIIRATVLPETSSGEHKVKISGIMASDAPQASKENFLTETAHFSYHLFLEDMDLKRAASSGGAAAAAA